MPNNHYSFSVVQYSPAQRPLFVLWIIVLLALVFASISCVTFSPKETGAKTSAEISSSTPIGMRHEKSPDSLGGEKQRANHTEQTLVEKTPVQREPEDQEHILQTQNEEPIVYIVQRGDTLSAIAASYGVSWCSIATQNGIANPYRIHANQRLVIKRGDNAPCLSLPTPSQNPRGPAGGGGKDLPVPPSTHIFISPMLCMSDGICPKGIDSRAIAYYNATLNEIVAKRALLPLYEQHEVCHAHQHWQINGGGAEGVTLDLREWFDTPQGRSFLESFARDPWIWNNLSPLMGSKELEDFAWTCALWRLNPQSLQQISSARYEWANIWIP